MGVLVVNERDEPYVLDGSGGKRQIAPGATQWFSDEEWTSVWAANRGPGQLRALSSNPGSIQTLFDYDGDNKLIYLGQAGPETADDDEFWTVKQFTYAGDNVAGIEVKNNVAWADRATLW